MTVKTNMSGQESSSGITNKLSCGLVMPISGGTECTSEHWHEVKEIIKESVSSIVEFDFTVSLVSESDEANIIQKRIINGLYESDIVVCDVSTLNANVMFELGMRLAFDKATIIIKDDSTSFVFDTSGFEHLIYPRDLRFSKVNEFKKTLARKIVETYKFSQEDNYSAFLGQYGEYRVRGLDEYAKNINGMDELIISTRDALEEIKNITSSNRKNMLDIDKRMSFLERDNHIKITSDIEKFGLNIPEKDKQIMDRMARDKFIKTAERVFLANRKPSI